MTDTDTEHEPETGSGSSGVTLDGLAAKVDRLADTVAGLVGQAHEGASRHEAAKLDRPTREVEGTREHAASLQEEIQAELAKLRQQEAAERKREETESRLKKVEKAVEKQPRPFRRVEQFMGWTDK